MRTGYFYRTDYQVDNGPSLIMDDIYKLQDQAKEALQFVHAAYDDQDKDWYLSQLEVIIRDMTKVLDGR